MAHQYQAAGFAKKLKESIPSDSDVRTASEEDISFVVPWDVGHWMNLAVVEVRDKSESELLSRFIKRANKFHSVFGRGRGHDEYFGVASDQGMKAYEAQVYATTRFTSSAFSQFSTIYKGYEGYATAYTEMRETEDECDQLKYMVKGRDFCVDLCGILDVFTPVVDMMTRGQSLSHLLWSSTKWWPRLRTILLAQAVNLREQTENKEECLLSPELFPKLSGHFKELSAGNPTFKGIELQEGWIVRTETVSETSAHGESGKKGRQMRIEWVARDMPDCLSELAELCDTVVDKIGSRYSATTSEVATVLGNCLDVSDILALLEGRGLSAQQRARIEQHGCKDFERFFAYVLSLPHVRRLHETDESLDLHHGLSNVVFRRFKNVIVQVVWQNLGDCRNVWFRSVDQDTTMPMSADLDEFKVVRKENSLEDEFEFRFGCRTYRTVLDEAQAFKTFYTKDCVYEAAGRELCIALDVALGMSGTEAVVESYYSVMKAQSQVGGQKNDTLAMRTNADWLLPLPIQCPHTMAHMAKMHLHGDSEAGVKAHRSNAFFDVRARAASKYTRGKFLDRLSRKTSKVLLLSEDRC